MPSNIPPPTLSREIGLFSATALVVANMIGTGIFTTSGFIMGELRRPAVMLLCWVVGGGVALCGALCYGELGARFPRAGGEYVFLKHAFGRPVGFLSGWVSLIVGFSAPIAAAAIAFSSYLFRALALPDGNEWHLSIAGWTVATVSPRILAAIGVVGVVSLLHCHSLRAGSRVQNVLTLFKAGLLVVFVLAGFGSARGTFTHMGPVPAIGDIVTREFAIALILVSFAYSGWNAAAYIGGEIRHPRRTIPAALIIGTSVVIILYLLLNLVYIYALSPEGMSGVLEIGAVSAAALFGGPLSGVVNGAIAVGLLSVLSAMILTGPRVYYAMARDGLFFQSVGRVGTHRGTPVYAICLQAALAVCMIFTAAYDWLLLYIGFTLSLSATLTVIGMMRLRLRSPLSPGAYSTIAYPLPPLVFIVANLWIIYASVHNRPGPFLAGLATLALGCCAYMAFGRRHTGPPRENAAPDGVPLPGHPEPAVDLTPHPTQPDMPRP